MSTDLIGREAELKFLHACLDRLHKGEGGSVRIVAEPGLGKTVILEAVASEADRQGLRVVSGSARQQLRFQPYALLTEAFAKRPGVLRGLAEPPARRPTGGAFGKYEIQEAFVDRVAGLAAGDAWVIALDDLHWADAASQRLLSEAITRLASEQVLWLLTSRPAADAHPPASSGRRVSRIEASCTVHLGPLDRPDVVKLAEAQLSARPGHRLQSLLDRAQGNPLHLVELCRHLMAEGWLRQEPGWGESGGIVDLPPDAPLPRGYRSFVLGAVAQLPPASQRTLQLACVLGSVCTVTALARVTNCPSGEIGHLLEPACDARLVSVTDGEVRFRHDLIRDAVYESLPMTVRMATHSEAARRLTDFVDGRGTLAWHHLLSRLPPHGQSQPPIASPVATLSAEDLIRWQSSRAVAMSETAPDTAADLLRATFEMAPLTTPLSDALHVQMAWTEMASGILGAGEATARTLFARNHDRHLDGDLLELLAESLSLQRRFDEAVPPLTEAIAIETRSDRTAQLRVARAINMRLSGVIDTSDEELRMVSQDARTPPETRSRAVRFLAFGQVLRGELAEALELARDARRMMDGDGEDLTDRAMPMYTLALALANADRWEEAHEEILNGIRYAEDRGHLVDLPLLLSLRASLLVMEGNWFDAVAEAETGLDVSRSLGSLRNVPLLYDVLAQVALQRGDRPMAVELVTNAERVTPLRLVLIPPNQLARTKSQLLIQRAEKWDMLRACWEVAVAQDAGGQLLELGPALTAASRLSSGAFLSSISAHVARIARRHGTNYAAGAAEWCQGLEQDDLEALQRGVAQLRRSPRQLKLADALVDLANAALGRRRRGLARDARDEAVAIYRRMGADGSADEASALLESAGSQRPARRPSPAAGGWESLTPTEREVVKLVALGLSNREIAERLFVSHRTVETHVSHSLVKVGVRSRVGLVKAVPDSLTPA